MRLAAVLKWAGIAAAVLVAAVVALLYSVDVDSYRGEIAEEFRKATGRELRIDGGIDLSISLSPAVVIEKVAVANAGWGSRPTMATVERAEAQVELIPLIAGDIRVTRLVLVEPDILLETDARGVPNWRFERPAKGKPRSTADAQPESGRQARSDAPGIPLFERMEIRRGRLTYRDGRTGETLRLDLAEVAARVASPGAPLTLEANGAWNRAPFSISGSIDSPARLASGKSVKLALKGEAFGFDAMLSGAVARPTRGAGIDLLVAVGGDDLSSLAPAMGPGLPKLGPVDLSARLTGDAWKIEVDKLKLKFGASDLSGKIVLRTPGPRLRVTGTLASTTLDLASLRSESRRSAAPAAEKPPPVEARQARVFPDEPIALDGLKAVDLDLKMSVGRLIGSSLPLTDVKARLKLGNGMLTVKPLSALVASSRVGGTLRLDARRDIPKLSLALKASELDLGRLLKEAGVTDLFEGNAAFSARLAGTGRSVAALMAGLDGDVRLLTGAGRLKTEAFDAAVGGASAAVGTLFSGRKQWTVVNCAAASFAVTRGRATSRATLIDTEYSTVAVRGAVDLASETLRLTVEPRAKTVTLNVAVPVHVRGTLAQPSFRPDTGAALKKLGGLLGIALFPPAAIAGLGELGDAGNECVKVAGAKRRPGAGSRSRPAAPEKAVEKLEKDAEDLLKGLGKGFRGIFGGGKN